MKALSKLAAIAAIVLVVGLIVSAIGMALLFSTESKNMGTGKNIVLTQQDILGTNTIVNDLIINIGKVEMTLKSGDSYSVTANRIVEKDLKTEYKNGALHISYNSKSSFWSWFDDSFSWFNFNHTPEITVTLPVGASYESVEINTGMGAADLSDISAGKLTLKVGMGEFKGRNIVSDFCKIEAGMGQVTLDGFIVKSDLFLECGMGELNLKGAVTGKSTVKCGMGSVTLDLDGDIEDYDIDVSMGMGECRINGHSQSGRRNTSAPNKINVSGGMGAIYLNIY